MKSTPIRRVHILALNEILEANIMLSLQAYAHALQQAGCELKGPEIVRRLGGLLRADETNQLILDYRQGKKTDSQFEQGLQTVLLQAFSVDLDSKVFWQCWNAMLSDVLTPEKTANIMETIKLIKNKLIGTNEKLFLISETNPAHMQVLMRHLQASHVTFTENDRGLMLAGIPIYLSYKPALQASKLALVEQIKADHDNIPLTYHANSSNSQHPQNSTEEGFRSQLLSMRLRMQHLDLALLAKDMKIVPTKTGVVFVENLKPM